MVLDGRGQFERAAMLSAGCGDRDDKDLRFAVVIHGTQEQSRRTVFGAFLAAFAMFTATTGTNNERRGRPPALAASRCPVLDEIIKMSCWRGSIFEFLTASMMSAGASAVAKTCRSRRLSR